MFHVSLLEQDPTKKERMNENVTELKFDASNNEEYKVEVIWNSIVYAKKLEGHLPGLY